MVPYISKVLIRNYKSFSQSAVDLTPFVVLVGPNGAGKSNFAEALAFVQESLSDSIEIAFKNRGGIGAVRRRSGGHPTNIEIGLTLELGGDHRAEYVFKIAAKPTERFHVARERCTVWTGSETPHTFEVEKGNFTRQIKGIRPKVTSDRFALFAASATEEFRPVYDFLTSMRFYSIAPAQLRVLQAADAGDYLQKDGSNAAAVLKRLKDEAPAGERYERLCRLLSRVVNGIQGVEYVSLGQKETVQFKQDVGLKHAWTFEALNMSDGTLRVLGLLLAVYQVSSSSVIVIEEPEATVHPAVTQLIMEVLIDASHDRQVLVTTHSPDILDYKDLKDDAIRVVTMERGVSNISPLLESSRRAIRERLYTPGELLRLNELIPDLKASEESAQQVELFDGSD
jgi:predicted ATPase